MQAAARSLYRQLPGRALGLAILAAAICAAPVIAVAWIALTGETGDYLRHLAGTRLATYLTTSAVVALIAATGAGVIGTGLGWLIARTAFFGRKTLAWVLILPLAVPAYVAAYAWLDLSHAGGPLHAMTGGLFPTIRGSWGSGLMFALVLYPYVYLLARDTFAGQSADAYNAARTLGAGPFTAFWRTSLPMARPAIAAGLALVVMESLADYGTVSHLGAPTLSIGLIRAWSGAGSLVDAARLSLVLVLIAIFIFGLERAQRSRARSVNAAGRHKPAPRHPLHGAVALAALAACLIPLVLGMVIPLGRLAWLALRTETASGLAAASLHSLTLAGSTALIAAGLGLATAYALRSRTAIATLAARAAGLGYAVPGAVAAVGVIALLSGTQALIDPAWRQLTGDVFPILLTGTGAALVFAYLSRFAAAAISPAETALARVTPSLDGAARTLGARRGRRVWRIHWPLIAAGVTSAGLLVFVEVLKELPATMILRPFNYDTLAIIAHNFATDERLGEAALPSLLIPLVALLPMIFVARYLSRQDH
ncbi:ABC transporter permease [Maricaulis maris]|jgi:iron(III) transport system permease protein|uniref:ABC transporter permease n=1 Tax=Maricaulis maris TaxID=74318 RepID=UPI00292640F8|nr:iron(III) ABC transporter permease [Maricaulis maris]